MVSVQPVGLSHYLSLKPHDVPKGLHRYFYVSWEDALWDLLDRYEIPVGSIALIPEFFCADVVQNMKKHGLKSVFYPVNQHFKTSSTVFKKYIKRHQPNVIVIFHAVGMTNSLFNESKKWLSAVSRDSLIIEDSVHRVVDPRQLTFISSKHFVIDSLRKVSPLPGSNLRCLKPLPPKQSIETKKISSYKFNVLKWWLLFQLYLTLGTRLPITRFRSMFFLKAEKAMINGYDLIGDSQKSVRGWRLFKKLALHLDFEKISKCKITQVEQYFNLLKNVPQTFPLFLFPIDNQDYGQLRGFPVGLYASSANTILSTFRNLGIFIRFELDESIWSKKYKVVYLPLGPHVSTENIKHVCDTFKNISLD